MGIYTPRPRLSSTEKRILEIIAEAITDYPTNSEHSNLNLGRIPLSNEAAEKLLVLLEEYVASRKFRERCEFIEAISGGSLKRAREIYLRGRTEEGRTRVAASWQWGGFQLRLGIGRDIPRGSTGTYMPFHHFLAMEERLFSELRLHPRVRNLVLQFVTDRRLAVELVRDGKSRLNPGAVASVPQPIVEDLHASRTGRGDHTLSLTKAVALATLTVDLSVLFTTRDWGVAGTLSAIAASIPPLAR